MKTDFFTVLDQSGSNFKDTFFDYLKNDVVTGKNLDLLIAKGMDWGAKKLPSLHSQLVENKVFIPKTTEVIPQVNIRDDLFNEAFVTERSNILDLYYLEKGLKCAKAVCRVNVKDDASELIETGTGFLIKGGYLVTNFHVLNIQEFDYSQFSNIEFNVQYNIDGDPAPTTRFKLDPNAFNYFSKEMDLAIVKVKELDVTGNIPLTEFGYLTISPRDEDPSLKFLSIIQHPEGGYKKIALRENHVVHYSEVKPYLNDMTDVEHLLWYATNTTNGSSGSPVFNDKWQLVAIHHSGIPIKKGDAYECIDNVYRTESQLLEIKNFKELLRYKANEGIRAKCLREALILSNIPL